jgi:ABC-type antimicrobial peptide transport system permease subunit
MVDLLRRAGLNPASPAQRTEEVEKMLGGFELNMTAMSLVSLLVGMFLIYNTVSASVVRRHHEIGILRSLGVTRNEVRTLFLGEAVVLGAIGSALGLIGGLLLARVLVDAVQVLVGQHALGQRREGDATDAVLAEYPDGLERATAALRNPNSGDVLVSAAPGYEFTDLAGRHHAGGGSHGSLLAGDSEVPLLTIGLGPAPASITGIASLLLDQLGLERPAYARALSHA